MSARVCTSSTRPLTYVHVFRLMLVVPVTYDGSHVEKIGDEKGPSLQIHANNWFILFSTLSLTFEKISSDYMPHLYSCAIGLT